MTLSGLVQDRSLLIRDLPIYAETGHPTREITFRAVEGKIHRHE